MKIKNIISPIIDCWNILLLLLLFPSISFAQSAQRFCGESLYFYNKKEQEQLEIFTKNWVLKNYQAAISRGKIQVPVVVHIVYQTEKENISDEQVWSQIDALNRDFNLDNKNLDRVPLVFQERIAEVGFEFCLASIDPNGLPTSGITRTSTKEELVFFNSANWIYHSEEGGRDAWNTQNYLNIWVTKTDGNVSGFGSKPFQNNPAEDGIIVESTYFGTIGTATPPFHLGRIATHEVGHYFNLFHTWGQEPISCDNDDFVADTPLQSERYFDCPTPTESSCNSQDITANFMNYSDDECLAMFTYGQALRMQAALIGARKGLLASNGCDVISTPNLNQEISIYPNPARYYFCIETHLEGMELIPFEIINTKGAIVQKGAAIPDGIQHFSTLPNGFYFIRFFPPNSEAIIKKLIIVE